MKILFTAIFLDGFHGSVIHIKELAEYYIHSKKDQFQVEVATLFVAPEVYLFYQKSGIKVTLIQEINTNIKYDIVFAYHFPTIDNLLRRGLKCEKLVLNSLSSFELLEIFPSYWNEASLLVVMSEETRQTHHQKYNIPLEKMLVFENSIPDIYIDYKSSKEHPKRTPKRIAVVSNHVPPEMRQMAQIAPSELAIDFFGIGQKNYTPIEPEILDRYDIIISIGKTVQYAIGLGIPAFEYDHFGGNGYITLSNFDHEATYNFSGRPQRRKLSPHDLLDEITSGYPEAYKQSSQLKEIGISRFLLSSKADNLIESVKNSPAFKGKLDNYILSIDHGVSFSQWLSHYKHLAESSSKRTTYCEKIINKIRTILKRCFHVFKLFV